MDAHRPQPRTATVDRATRTREALVRYGAAGTVLKAARVSRGYAVEKVGAAIGMRADFITAMEEERIDRLPGSGYALGMVLRYALFLDLEPSPLIERFRRLSASEGLGGADTEVAPPRLGVRRALWVRFAGGLLVTVGLLLAAVSTL